jgi:hypothetical protein
MAEEAKLTAGSALLPNVVDVVLAGDAPAGTLDELDEPLGFDTVESVGCGVFAGAAEEEEPIRGKDIILCIDGDEDAAGDTDADGMSEKDISVVVVEGAEPAGVPAGIPGLVPIEYVIG